MFEILKGILIGLLCGGTAAAIIMLLVLAIMKVAEPKR